MIKTVDRAGGATFQFPCRSIRHFTLKMRYAKAQTEIRFPRLGSTLRSLRIPLHPVSTHETFSLLPLFPFILSSIATREREEDHHLSPRRLSALRSPQIVVHPKRSLE